MRYKSDCTYCYDYVEMAAKRYGISKEEVWNALDDYLVYVRGNHEIMTSEEKFYMDRILEGR